MLILSILLILFSNAVSSRRDKTILYSRQAILVMVYSTIIAVNVYSYSSLLNNSNIGLYNGLYVVNSVTQSFDIFLFIVGILIIQLNAFFPKKISKGLTEINKETENLKFKLGVNNTQYKIVEYSLILLFIILGATLIMSSCNIVSVFLSIELQSFGLYILSTIYRNSESSTTAGLTYFLLGALSSCFILLGSAFLYASFGTTDLEGYYIINSIFNVQQALGVPGTHETIFAEHEHLYKESFIQLLGIDLTGSLILNVSLVFISVGLLFKISAAPFHFWSPDVYDSIPTVVTTFVAIIAKISILIFLYQIINYLDDNVNQNIRDWKFALIISSYMSLIVGTVLGLTETRIKRLLAYSTVSHLGFILLAISIKSSSSNQAFLFYLIQYTMSSLNIFIILIMIGYTICYSTKTSDNPDLKRFNIKEKDNSPIQLINQLKGFYTINPVLAICLIITLFSLVGIPPLLGFFAKQMVLASALENNYISITLLAVITSVISAVYYLNIVRHMYFAGGDLNSSKTNLEQKSNDKSEIYICLSSALSVTVSILTLYILVFMFNANNLLNVVQIIALNINELN